MHANSKIEPDRIAAIETLIANAREFVESPALHFDSGSECRKLIYALTGELAACLEALRVAQGKVGAAKVCGQIIYPVTIEASVLEHRNPDFNRLSLPDAMHIAVLKLQLAFELLC